MKLVFLLTANHYCLGIQCSRL